MKENNVTPDRAKLLKVMMSLPNKSLWFQKSNCIFLYHKTQKRCVRITIKKFLSCLLAYCTFSESHACIHKKTLIYHAIGTLYS